MFTPQWDNGTFSGVARSDGASIPADIANRDYRKFLTWLVDQDKTLQQWLDEHPYTPPAPDPDDVETQRQIKWVRDNWSALTAREKLIIRLMARRSFPELKDLV